MRAASSKAPGLVNGSWHFAEKKVPLTQGNTKKDGQSRRERPKKKKKIEEIEGIGPVLGAKLRDAGATTVE
ncbi:MAG: hypothetical protein AB8H86_21265, partial [Polyangiales bacterium]